MPQASKILKSREKWKAKAIALSAELRAKRKIIKRDKMRIEELKIKLEDENIETKKKIVPPTVVSINEANATRSLCVLLVLDAVVSYRSIPRTLTVFNKYTSHHQKWIPHFTSVINWTLRFGLGLLQQVHPISVPWIAIIDHSIDVGTKKVLVVLRVRMDEMLNKGRAIQLEDCECIGLKVCETVNGKSTYHDLDAIFAQAGLPDAVLKDCDYTLQKGVRLLSETQKESIPVIEDIGHVIASGLKHDYEDNACYQSFTEFIKTAGQCLRQTRFAFITPPKLRTKARFQNIGALGKWSDTIIKTLAVRGRAKGGSVLEKLRDVLPGFLALRPFLKEFSKTLMITSKIMGILKNEGLNQNNSEQCHKLVQDLPKNSNTKERLLSWLKNTMKFKKR